MPGMPNLFRSGDDRLFASLISRLLYCNPFTAERLHLEFELLGVDRETVGEEWSFDIRDETRHKNMANLHNQMEPVLMQNYGLFRDGKGSEEDRNYYRDMAVLYLYTQIRAKLDGTIREVYEMGNERVKISFYDTFLEKFHYFFGNDHPISPDHLFACFFQIRRAFYHIYRFFVGSSRTATQLRARVWESIFSHDLFRYQRVLYNHMATIPTLITGPSGTGKEVVARAIGFSQYVKFDPHKKVFDKEFSKGFYAVNLSALSPTLIESELFGHRKGAFTGALQDREGYFSACGEHGVVFLDEIGDTNEEIQIKLLRVLQTRNFQRLGDVHTEVFRGKVIAATNRDLDDEIKAGRFREDFYFRLRSDVIETPPLIEMIAEDKKELEHLAEYVSASFVGIDEADGLMRDFLGWNAQHLDYVWPGNFRELEQAIRSILIHGTYEPPERQSSTPEDKCFQTFIDANWNLQRLTSEYVKEVYRRTPVIEKVARQLGVDRRTVKKYLEA